MSGPSQIGMGMPSSAAEEASALKKVMWFGIIELVGVVAGWVVAFYAFTSILYNASLFASLPSNPTSAQVAAALGPLFQDFVYIIPIALGVELVALIVLTLGFRGLAKVDRGKFGISTPFMVILVVGLMIFGTGAILVLNAIPNMIANIRYPYQGYTPSSAFFNQFGSVFAYFGVLAVGGLLALIGFIGGLILGLWRVGSRYNQTIIKVGAIFEIIPLLQIIAPILIIIGANEAKNALPK